MARPLKQGLDYFPTDCSFYQDIKIRKLIKYNGGVQAVVVYHILLCMIYDKGYYIAWDSDIPFYLDEQTHLGEDYILKVINSAVELGLFDATMYKDQKVLTSSGIQKRYFAAWLNAKRKLSDNLPYLLVSLPSSQTKKNKVNSEGNLFSSEETPIISEETKENTEETPESSGKSAQKKEKEKKDNNGGTIVPSSSDDPTTDKDEPINILAFQDFFNRTMQEHGAQIPTITQIGGKRLQALRARCKEYGKDKLRAAIINAAKSPFLNGASEKPFVANIDWILRPNNFPKVLEGNYNHDVLISNSNGHGTSQQLTAQQRIEKSLEEGAEYYAGLVARNETSVRDGVPTKVW